MMVGVPKALTFTPLPEMGTPGPRAQPEPVGALVTVSVVKEICPTKDVQAVLSQPKLLIGDPVQDITVDGDPFPAEAMTPPPVQIVT